jgi:hypothetical protein
MSGRGATEVQMEKITLGFWDEENRPIVMASFAGIALVGDEIEGLRAIDDSRTWDAGVEWSVFETAKNLLLVFRRYGDDSSAPTMLLYDSFAVMKAAAAKDGIPANVLAATAAALVEEFEIKLDI